MNNIKAIIFDFDDTLALSSEEVVRAIEHTAQICDLPCPEREAIIEMFGRPLRLIVETFWPFANPEEFVEVYNGVYQIHNVRLIEKAKEVLEQLSLASFELHILTSRRRESLIKHLEQFAIKGLFKSLIAYEDVEYHKPDPRAFSVFFEKYKPNEVVYVGDSVYDMHAAKQAGIFFIGVCTGIVTREGFELKKADVILDSVAQLGSSFFIN